MTTSPVLSLGIAFGLVIIFCIGCMTAIPAPVEAVTTSVLSSIPNDLDKLEEPTTKPEETPSRQKGIPKTHLFMGEDSLYYRLGSEVPFSGKAKILSKYGEFVYEGQFKDGLREGEGTEWNKIERKKCVGLWKSDRFFTGTVFYYYTDQKTDLISLRGEYKEGRLVGGVNLDRNGERY